MGRLAVVTAWAVIACALLGWLPAQCQQSPAGGVWRAALHTRLALDRRIDLAPVQTAAESAGCETVSVGDGELVFTFAGMSGNYAFVRGDGNLFICSEAEVRKLEDKDKLDQDLERVVAFIEKVSPALPAEARLNCLYYLPTYYLPAPLMLKRLIFRPESYQGVVNVPKCRAIQARVCLLPIKNKVWGFEGYLKLRGQFVERGATGAVRVYSDVTEQLVFGAHDLLGYHVLGAMVIELLAEPTADKLYYTVKSGGEAAMPETQSIGAPEVPIHPRAAIGLARAEVKGWLELSSPDERGKIDPQRARELVAQCQYWLGRRLWTHDDRAVDGLAALQRATELNARLVQAQVLLAHALHAAGNSEARNAALRAALDADGLCDPFGPFAHPQDAWLRLSEFEGLARDLDAGMQQADKLSPAIEAMRGALSTALAAAAPAP